MATLTASKSTSMNSIADLAILNAGDTNWSSASKSFTATSVDGSISIEATGLFTTFGPGVKPTVGTVTGYTVKHGSDVIYSFTHFNALGMDDFLNAVAGDANSFFSGRMFHADTVTGSNQNDVLKGYDGNDTINGGGGNDKIIGGDGSDDLKGSGGNDVIKGGAGLDTLNGGNGADKLNGGADGDTLRGGAGKDAINGGGGIDTVLYNEKTADISVTLHGGEQAKVMIGGQQEDTLKNVENLTSGEGNDTITGDAAGNEFRGNGGNDFLSGKAGYDVIFGGEGNDTLIGGTEDDYLNGGTGVDHLKGGAGNDNLLGESGNDVMTGGGGADAFYFTTGLNADTNVDKITDFQTGVDQIVLLQDVFSAITPDEEAAQNYFAIGSAQDEHDHIIYKAGSGKLLYDPDGDGAQSAIQFAQLDKHLTLTVNDFIVL
jgi:Ca2+-binding RTX toxin-like protein